MRTSPVPLRSAFALWGRHDLSPKEQRQVRTANVLLVYAIAFATLSAVYGIANWTEHPDLLTRYSWLTAPSIWLTEETRRLQVLPNVHSHRLQHCTDGKKAEEANETNDGQHENRISRIIEHRSKTLRSQQDVPPGKMPMEHGRLHRQKSTQRP